MGLSVGDRVGPYEVIGLLGEGGMGSVWRARDARLGRDVALKVLPDGFLGDGDRLARLTRESLMLAALNHPHIATILGVEDTPSGHAIVMELIGGPTLADRLASGPLPVRDALALARDIAGALGAAHDRGIVHRDLKPANLKFTSDDRIKVLDFGLAKSVPGGPGETSRSPTNVSTSEAGLLLGTAPYMSPEQARGVTVDRRADVWSFGCVLYEMLTGRRAFDGASVADVLAAVITRDPDWSALPEPLPASVRRLLHACLRRDPRERLRDMGDVHLLLDDVLAGREEEHEAAASRQAPASWWRRPAIGWTVAALALGGGYLAGSRLSTRSDTVPLRKLEVSVQDPALEIFSRPRISPDGRAIVYSALDRLWIRRLDRLDPVELPGARNAEVPFWSPDGRHLAFARARKLWRIALDGTQPMAICDLPSPGRIITGAWRDDDTILFGAWQGPLFQVPARGGDPVELLPLDPAVEVDFHELATVPGDVGVIFVRHERGSELQHVEMLVDGRRIILLRARGGVRYDNPRYDPRGYLLYERLDVNAGIWAVRLPRGARAIVGEPFRVAPGGTMPSVSRDGTLVYAEQSVSYELAWVDRVGSRIERIGAAQPELQFPAISPDGQRVAVAAADETRVQDRDLWLIDVATGRRGRLYPTPTATRDIMPTWAPDGRSLVYVQARRDPLMAVFVRLDGTTAGASGDIVEASGRASFSHDGRHLVYPRVESNRSDLWWLTVGPSGFSAPSVLLADGSRNVGPVFSPIAPLVAYSSDRSGQDEVYLRRFPPGDERWRLTPDGGLLPTWSADGTELFYRAPDGAIWSVPVRTRPDVTVGAPRKALDAAECGAVTLRGFEPSRDGKRFLVVRRSDAARNMHLIVVRDWLTEFEH